ncbi:MAG: VTT domain-containing protein [Prevotella sp.]|nr:VTT domain-containing protein [Prevotella sp.]MDY6027079.1 VTT domain-containing protein [Prevotella sp.]
MDALIQLLTEYGYLGMLAAAFLAGSFFPFSSELVMVGLMAAGLDPLLLVVYGTVGNVLGSVFNYGVGYMGRIDWIEKYLHVRKEKLERTRQFLAGRGAWMGILAFLPILGSVVTIVLGLMRANMTITFISITIGKFLRYLLLVYGVGIFI